MEAVCVLAYLVLPGSPQAKQLCHLHAQLLLGQSCHRQKKSLAPMHAGSFQQCLTLCNPVDCGLPGFSIRWGYPPARTMEHMGQYWLPYPSIFPAALVANTPEYLVLPESLQPKQLHHLHTWPLQGQTQVLQGSLRSKPQWTTHMQRWK